MPEIPGQLPLFDAPPAAGQPDEIRHLRLVLEETKTANRKLVTQLAEHKQRPDPNRVLLTRLNLLIDALLPGEAERLEFEVAFEQEIGRLLRGWVQQATQRRLLDLDTPLPTNGKPLIGGNIFIAP